MHIIKTIFDSVFLIEPKNFEDNRGFFYESYNDKKMLDLGIKEKFIQDNHSLSKSKGTIRGMHFQSAPMAQSKLIRVIKGEIQNYIVDIRKDSKTYLAFDSVVLSNTNKHFLYIPKGFANGFKTLTDNTEVLYKVDNYYSPENDYAFRYDDPQINIPWDVTNPILSLRDNEAKLFNDISDKVVF